jgi:hypothetical protein
VEDPKNNGCATIVFEFVSRVRKIQINPDISNVEVKLVLSKYFGIQFVDE